MKKDDYSTRNVVADRLKGGNDIDECGAERRVEGRLGRRHGMMEVVGRNLFCCFLLILIKKESNNVCSDVMWRDGMWVC